MRDFMPLDVARRRHVVGVVQEVYERYGFEIVREHVHEPTGHRQLRLVYRPKSAPTPGAPP